MSDGYCEVDFSDASDDAEPVQFYDSAIVKARKPHICTECGGAIQVGEEHRRISYKFEGAFSVDRMCEPCSETAGEFDFHIVCGLLWESFYNEWDQGAHVQACINRLTTARAKEHMRQQWLKWQEKRNQQRLAAIARRQARPTSDKGI